MKKINLILYFFVIALFCSCENKNEKRLRINLAGEWEFYDARSNNDILPDIPPLAFEDKVVLPGTTDTNKKGTLTQDRSETSHLTRIYNYEGKAWYKKQIAIPPTWQDKDIILILERTKPSQVWINDIYVGRNDNISTSQVYDLTHSLVPGIHNITILVDNGNSVPEQIISNAHAYTN